MMNTKYHPLQRLGETSCRSSWKYSVQCEILSLRDQCSVADEHLLRKTSCILFSITGLRGFPICFNNQSYCPTSGNRPANRCSCSLQLCPPTVGVCQGWAPSRVGTGLGTHRATTAEWTEQDLPRLCGATMTSEIWRILKTVTTLGNLQISLSGLCPNISESIIIIIVDLPTNADFNVKPVNCGAPYLQTNQYAINCHVNNILQNRAYSNLHKKYLTVQLDSDATHQRGHHVLIQTLWIDQTSPKDGWNPIQLNLVTKPLVKWF